MHHRTTLTCSRRRRYFADCEIFRTFHCCWFVIFFLLRFFLLLSFSFHVAFAFVLCGAGEDDDADLRPSKQSLHLGIFLVLSLFFFFFSALGFCDTKRWIFEMVVGTIVQVTNISSHATDKQLRDLFGIFGDVLDLKLYPRWVLWCHHQYWDGSRRFHNNIYIVFLP